jgi:hypothetical protein
MASQDFRLDSEVLAGSLDDTVVVHVSKQPSAKDGFVPELGNVFSIRLKHDLPTGSPPDLVWIQIGRGYPWRKESGEPGTAK